MTPEAQRIAIAEACGMANNFVIVKRGLFYRPNGHGYTSDIGQAWIVSEQEADEHTYAGEEAVTKHKVPPPDYLNDLNTMHEAEKSLTPGQSSVYAGILRTLLGFHQHTYFDLAHVTSEKRAEAFLKSINKWDDSK